MIFKVTKTISKPERKYSSVYTNFYVNGIKVASLEKRRECFHTVRNGTPSRLRDNYKWAYSFSWDKDGLKRIIGNTDALNSFENFYPNLRYGFAGQCITSKYVAEKIIPHLSTDIWQIKTSLK